MKHYDSRELKQSSAFIKYLCFIFLRTVPSNDCLQPLTKSHLSLLQEQIIWQSCPYVGKVHFVSQLFPLNPTAQAMFKKNKIKNTILQNCTYYLWKKHCCSLSIKLLYVSLTQAFHPRVVPSVSNTTYYISTRKSTMILYKSNWECNTYFGTSIFKRHSTYLPHILQNTEDNKAKYWPT